MLLRVIAANPRSRAIASRSNGNPLPASAPDPERHHVHARRALSEALVIAREHFEIRQQVMRPQDRLRAAQVGVAGDRWRPDTCRARSSSAPINSASSCEYRVDRIRAATAAYRATPVRCGCGRCGSCPPARRPLLQLANDQVWTSSSAAPSKNAGSCASCAISSNACDQCLRARSRSGCRRFSSARANACEPRISASCKRLSKCSEPENRSKTSEARLKPPAPEFHG